MSDGTQPGGAPRRRRERVLTPLVAGLIAGGTAFAVGVALTADEDGVAGRSPATTAAAQPDGRAVFARMACGGCHTLAAAGSGGQMGPNLDERLPRYTRATLKAKITDPYPDRKASEPAYVNAMPRDFAERMSDAELDALVGWLLAAAQPAQSG